MTSAEEYDTLRSSINALSVDFKKFNEKKVKIAGSRIRSKLLDIKKITDSLRVTVLADIKKIPIKKRVVKEKALADEKITFLA